MTSTTVTATFVARPIDRKICDQLRVLDDAGNPPEITVDVDGGSPLRCCLDVSRPGEQIALVSYAPLRRWAAATGADPGPYSEIGPVFLHAMRCAGASSAGYPTAYRGWPRVLRGYDVNGRIVGARIVAEGEAPEPLIDEMFAEERVAFLNARALDYGCFTFWIDRAGAATRSDS